MIERLREAKKAYFLDVGEELRALKLSTEEFVALLMETRGLAKAGKGWMLVEGVCVYT